MRNLPKILAGLMGTAFLAGPALAAGNVVSPTEAWNHTWDHILIDLWVIGIVFGLIAIYFLIRYRAKSPDQVGEPVKLSNAQMWAWALIPAALFMADDFLLAGKGWTLWNIQRTVPSNALEVKVTGSQWFFEFDYGNGVVSNDELVVPVGQPVVLRMTANDVIHSFGLAEYRLKEDLLPGRITYMWFYPDKPLDSQVVCMEFCGTAHANMTTAVKAVPKADYDAWIAKHKKTAAVEQPVKVAGQSSDSAPVK
jgi:cytochrome c oxidase subunit II